MKNNIYIIPALFLAVLLLTNCDIYTDQDKAFTQKIAQALQSNGDSILVSDLHKGEWTKVCPIVEYQRVSEKAAWALDINPITVEIINGVDEVIMGDHTGFLFIYPPYKVEYLKAINYYHASGNDCTSRKNAKFILIEQPKNIFSIKITK